MPCFSGIKDNPSFDKAPTTHDPLLKIPLITSDKRMPCLSETKDNLLFDKYKLLMSCDCIHTP